MFILNIKLFFIDKKNQYKKSDNFKHTLYTVMFWFCPLYTQFTSIIFTHLNFLNIPNYDYLKHFALNVNKLINFLHLMWNCTSEEIPSKQITNKNVKKGALIKFFMIILWRILKLLWGSHLIIFFFCLQKEVKLPDLLGREVLSL